MPPRVDVVGHPEVVLALEIAWGIKPTQDNQHLSLDVLRRSFILKTFHEGTYLRTTQEGDTFVRLANWDGLHWQGDMRWPSFSYYFSSATQTIWFMGRLLVNNPYENLIIDHARTLTTDLVPRWYYVGQMGRRTHWSVDIDGHPTMFHSNPKED